MPRPTPAARARRSWARALRELDWPRWSYVLTTKVFWGIHGETPNMRNTLNRKYLMQAIDGSLERFGLDFVDVLYCHRSDPDTPIEETVWAMSDIITSGKALYWGTSEWSADEIRAAIDIAERHHLHKPVTEQSQYNLLERKRVEHEYARINAEFNYGNTIWSPLASGLLTGKYKDGIPDDSRAALERLRLARRSAERRRGDRPRREAPSDRRPTRLHDGAAGARLVHEEPARVDRDHRCIQGQPGGVELRDHRRASRSSPTRSRKKWKPPSSPDPNLVADGTLPPMATADDKLPIKMLNDRVLVRISDKDGERKSSGGIVIPATAQVAKRLIWATVVAQGQNVRSCEVGDKVLFSPEDRYEVEVQGEDYVMLRERELHAVAAERIEASTGLYL